MFKGRQIGMVYRASHAVDLVVEHMKVEIKRVERRHSDA